MKTLFKKIFVIAFTIILSGLASVSHGQQMTVNGYDAANPKTGDYYEITWYVVQWNTAHTIIINSWQSTELSLAAIGFNYIINPFSSLCPFSIINGANLPVIFTPDFRVTCSAKRRSGGQNGDIVAGGQSFSDFLTTSQLTGSFSVSVIIN